MKSVVEGMGRARVRRFIFNEEFFKAEAEPIEEPTISDTRLESVTSSVLSAFKRERLKTASMGKNQPEAFRSRGDKGGRRSGPRRQNRE